MYERVARNGGDGELLLDFLERRAGLPAATPAQIREAVDLAVESGPGRSAPRRCSCAPSPRRATPPTASARAPWAVLALAERRLAAGRPHAGARPDLRDRADRRGRAGRRPRDADRDARPRPPPRRSRRRRLRVPARAQPGGPRGVAAAAHDLSRARRRRPPRQRDLVDAAEPASRRPSATRCASSTRSS